MFRGSNVSCLGHCLDVHIVFLGEIVPDMFAYTTSVATIGGTTITLGKSIAIHFAFSFVSMSAILFYSVNTCVGTEASSFCISNLQPKDDIIIWQFGKCPCVSMWISSVESILVSSSNNSCSAASWRPCRSAWTSTKMVVV